MLTETTDTTLSIIERMEWLRLSPPVIAITLAVIFREVNFALLLAIFGGCLLLPGAPVDQFCDVLVGQLADADHASVILFTVLLGAMIGLMKDSGGTAAVVDRLTQFANTRRKGQILTWLSGLVVFFDDYANTMLIGGAMRPLSDRLRISRAKLAFLIDATAAPVAGLALSTWTAFEVDQIAAGLTAAGVSAAAGDVFLDTIPFRIYPLLAIAAVGAVAFSGRDFGAMLKAEETALAQQAVADSSPANEKGGRTWFAVVPIIVLIAIVMLRFVVEIDDYRLLLMASMGGSAAAVVLPVLGRRMSIGESSRSWVDGIRSMIPAVIILVLAWSLSDVCRREKLDTAGYIISLVADSVNPEFLPSVAFLTAGAIAAAIGSSFTTMALLLPMFIPLSWSVLSGSPATNASVTDPIFLATIGAILAGAIFGDHCSPISDTTVLSSAASGCDHLEHVTTQLPYALLVAACSLIFGYLPVGFGVPWWIALPVSLAACAGAIVLLGRRPGPAESASAN